MLPDHKEISTVPPPNASATKGMCLSLDLMAGLGLAPPACRRFENKRVWPRHNVPLVDVPNPQISHVDVILDPLHQNCLQELPWAIPLNIISEEEEEDRQIDNSLAKDLLSFFYFYFLLERHLSHNFLVKSQTL